LSPAYHLSSYKKARWAPWLHRFVPWIDRGLSDDAMRYEAMPTRGVAETVKAIKAMRQSVKKAGSIDKPWLLIQSTDDLVTLPANNVSYFMKRATHPLSKVIEFSKKETIEDSIADYSSNERVARYPAYDDPLRVLGLTHTSVHIAPDNPHYGIQGDYRNCGGTAPRDQTDVERCMAAEKVWYGLWDQEVKPGRAQAMSTFNPHYKLVEAEVGQFIEKAFPF